MPKIDETKKLTASITIKLTQGDHDVARALADRQQLPLAEWARDRFLEVLGMRGASPEPYAILAEIISTEDILLDLAECIARREALTPQRIRQIAEGAYARKYKDVSALFKDAQSDIEARRRGPAKHPISGAAAPGRGA